MLLNFTPYLPVERGKKKFCFYRWTQNQKPLHIYNLPIRLPMGFARVVPHYLLATFKGFGVLTSLGHFTLIGFVDRRKLRKQDLNLRPLGYEPSELTELLHSAIISTLRSVNRTFFPYKAFSHLLTGASLYSLSFEPYAYSRGKSGLPKETLS